MPGVQGLGVVVVAEQVAAMSVAPAGGAQFPVLSQQRLRPGSAVIAVHVRPSPGAQPPDESQVHP